MTFTQLVNEITTVQTQEGLELAIRNALDASYNQFIGDIERTNDHASAERAYDRRNDAIYAAQQKAQSVPFFTPTFETEDTCEDIKTYLA